MSPYIDCTVSEGSIAINTRRKQVPAFGAGEKLPFVDVETSRCNVVECIVVNPGFYGVALTRIFLILLKESFSLLFDITRKFFLER